MRNDHHLERKVWKVGTFKLIINRFLRSLDRWMMPKNFKLVNLSSTFQSIENMTIWPFDHICVAKNMSAKHPSLLNNFEHVSTNKKTPFLFQVFWGVVYTTTRVCVLLAPCPASRGKNHVRRPGYSHREDLFEVDRLWSLEAFYAWKLCFDQGIGGPRELTILPP